LRRPLILSRRRERWGALEWLTALLAVTTLAKLLPGLKVLCAFTLSRVTSQVSQELGVIGECCLLAAGYVQVLKGGVVSKHESPQCR